jgi:CRP/FNR family transcriptional regulator, anaerobic regulatory protein
MNVIIFLFSRTADCRIRKCLIFSAMDFAEKLHNAFELHGEKKILSKGDFLIKEGEIERKVYRVESGVVRVFLLSEFEEQTIRFGYQGSIINSLASFIRDRPSEFYIDALRKTTVSMISKEIFSSIVHSDDDGLRSYALMMESLIVQQIEREVDLLTASPTERLARVLKRSPNLFQEVPLKYIASYLRMTPETLSRIRNS